MIEQKAERLIIRAYGMPIDKAVEIVDMVGVRNLLKEQIDGDDVIDKVGDCLVYLTTKNRTSIGIDVWKPKNADNGRVMVIE